MEVEILEDAQALAKRGAQMIASAARDAVASRQIFIVGLSGGQTPWQMLRLLCDESLPWDKVHIVQVDERVAPQGSADRNLTHLNECLRAAPLTAAQIHAMPVDIPGAAAAKRYADMLQGLAGSPPVLDLVQLGLGVDGHTASLIPGDEVLEVVDRDVAFTGLYQNRIRMTLTYPAINRARQILWLVSGKEKAIALARLRAGDAGIPAGRIRQDRAHLLADRAAYSVNSGNQ